MSRNIETTEGKKATRFDGFFVDPEDVKVDHSMNVRFTQPEEDDPEIIEMAQSLIKIGQLQPCLVRPIGGNKYQLFVGYRRHFALTLANKWQTAEGKPLLKLKVIALKKNPEDAFYAAIAENNIRREHSPMDVAKIIVVLRESYGHSAAEIAERLPKNRNGQPMSESWIAQIESLVNLDGKLQMAVHKGELSVSDAAKLLDIQEPNRLPVYELAQQYKDAEQQDPAKRVQVTKGDKTTTRAPRSSKGVGEANLRKAAEAMGEELGGMMRMSEFRNALMVNDGPGNSLKVRKIMRLTNQYLQRAISQKTWIDSLEHIGSPNETRA